MINLVDQEKILRRLYDLMREITEGKISVMRFCEEYERAYNLELEKKLLSEKEAIALKSLFDKVVWFSPYPEERQQIPRYLDENAILCAVEAASKALA